MTGQRSGLPQDAAAGPTAPAGARRLSSVAVASPRTTASARSTSAALGGCVPSPASRRGESRAQPPSQPRLGATRAARGSPRTPGPAPRRSARRASAGRSSANAAPARDDGHDVATRDVVEQGHDLGAHAVASEVRAVVGRVARDVKARRRHEGVHVGAGAGRATASSGRPIGASPSTPAPRIRFSTTVSARSSIVCPVSAPRGSTARRAARARASKFGPGSTTTSWTTSSTPRRRARTRHQRRVVAAGRARVVVDVVRGHGQPGGPREQQQPGRVGPPRHREVHRRPGLREVAVGEQPRRLGHA